MDLVMEKKVHGHYVWGSSNTISQNGLSLSVVLLVLPRGFLDRWQFLDATCLKSSGKSQKET